MKKQEFYFFTTQDRGARMRVVPLGSQTVNGKTVDVEKNVRCSYAIRKMHPVGTVFVSTDLVDSDTHYDIPDKKIYSVSGTSNITASEEMIKAFEEYKTVSGSAIPEVKEEELSLLQKIRRDKKYSSPKISDEGFHVNDDIWYVLMRNYLKRRNTMLSGPTGTGKTELILLMAKHLGVPVHVYDMGALHDPMSALLGTHRIDAAGTSEFDYARFTQDIAKPGIIVLDELSRAPLSTNNILFPCLDSRRELPVEIASAKGTRNIKVHPDCVFYATANIGAEYTGTNMIDRALQDRFFMVELDYLPIKTETEILVKRTGVDRKQAEIITSYCKKIRDSAKAGTLSTSVSTRHSLEIGELVHDGFDMISACEAVLFPLFEGSKSEGERSTIAAIIQGK
jgi:nitric oxide reductase NorQ protein